MEPELNWSGSYRLTGLTSQSWYGMGMRLSLATSNGDKHHCGQLSPICWVGRYLYIDSQQFLKLTRPGPTRGHPWRLEKLQVVSRERWLLCAFSTHVVNPWNALPTLVMTAMSLNQFKSRLDSHWTQEKYTIHINDFVGIVLLRAIEWRLNRFDPTVRTGDIAAGKIYPHRVAFVGRPHRRPG